MVDRKIIRIRKSMRKNLLKLVMLKFVKRKHFCCNWILNKNTCRAVRIILSKITMVMDLVMEMVIFVLPITATQTTNPKVFSRIFTTSTQMTKSMKHASKVTKLFVVQALDSLG
jgi:hypothetical protein